MTRDYQLLKKAHYDAMMSVLRQRGIREEVRRAVRRVQETTYERIKYLEDALEDARRTVERIQCAQQPEEIGDTLGHAEHRTLTLPELARTGEAAPDSDDEGPVSTCPAAVPETEAKTAEIARLLQEAYDVLQCTSEKHKTFTPNRIIVGVLLDSKRVASLLHRINAVLTKETDHE